jgi:hypothetical protein
MTLPDEIDKTTIFNYLRKGWLTHDAMWYYHIFSEFGVDTANRLNRAAIKSMSKFEVERSKAALGMNDATINSFNGLKDFVTGSLALLIPSSMKWSLIMPRKNIMRWEWGPGECFAYKGMKRIGASGTYQCGVIFRIECWLEHLGIKYSVKPKLDICVMQSQGTCSGEFEFYFKE